MALLTVLSNDAMKQKPEEGNPTRVLLGNNLAATKMCALPNNLRPAS